MIRNDLESVTNLAQILALNHLIRPLQGRLWDRQATGYWWPNWSTPR